MSCHPLTDGGNCYEPGEFCRESDHGVTGTAGDRKAIKCINNHGWRWEPASRAAASPLPAEAVPQTSPPAPRTSRLSCHPLTDGGNCYEPGEFCRESDHGVTGTAGDGKAIKCTNNDGWRWEPA